MSEEIKEKDDGGLMYQQLRKFISVIVSYYLFFDIKFTYISYISNINQLF